MGLVIIQHSWRAGMNMCKGLRPRPALLPPTELPAKARKKGTLNSACWYASPARNNVISASAHHNPRTEPRACIVPSASVSVETLCLVPGSYSHTSAGSPKAMLHRLSWSGALHRDRPHVRLPLRRNAERHKHALPQLYGSHETGTPLFLHL